MVNQYKEKIRRFDCAVKIVILDDELEFSKILDKKIKEYCARKDLLYDCQIFSSGKTLLEDDLSSIQVAFLDIDMPEFNGLDLQTLCFSCLLLFRDSMTLNRKHILFFIFCTGDMSCRWADLSKDPVRYRHPKRIHPGVPDSS